MTDKTDERTDQVLGVLTDGWLSRSQIAAKLGQNYLNQRDYEALATLAALGMIQVEKRPNKGPIGYSFFYRLANHD